MTKDFKLSKPMKLAKIIAMVPLAAVFHTMPYNLICLAIQGTAFLILYQHLKKRRRLP